LKTDGTLIIGFVDRKSPVGMMYEKHKDENVFYKDATFFSVDEVVSFLKKAGFKDFTFSQTIFSHLNEINNIEPVKEGYGEGSFVVISGVKKKQD